ncbi:MAG: tetratricopeptide repeat protein [Gammaproteobacteria bacterium]
MSVVVQADQYDLRLDGLFSRLTTTKNGGMAQLISEDIWNIWSRLDNQEVSELFRHGESAMNRGDFQAALKDFNKVIEIAPDFAEGWNKRATVYYQAGNYQASLEDIIETLKLEPRHFGAITGRGLCYMKLDKWQLALTSFEQALVINPWLQRVSENIKSLKRMLKQAV